MKSNKLRVLSATLAVLMAVATSACSAAPDSSSVAPNLATSTPTTSTPVTSNDPVIPFKETVELTFFGAMWSPYTAEQTEILEEIQRRTNTKITFEWTARDTFGDKLSAVLAGGVDSLPDFISYGSEVKNLDILVDQEAIIPLDDLLATYGQDYLKACGPNSEPDVKFASDGKYYAFRAITDYPPSYSYMVRKDWMKNVGIEEVPTTWDGWLSLWRAFRDNDANGDGNKNNEIPFGSYADLRGLAYLCGIELSANYRYANFPDGSYGVVSEHPNYQLLLDTARQLYTEKLLAPEFQSYKKDGDLFAVMDNNTCGSVFTWAERAKLSTIVNKDLSADALWMSIVPITGPKGDQMLPARAKFSQGTAVTVGAEKRGKAEQAVQLINWLYSEEGTRLLNFGIEGKHHDMVNGKPVLRTPYIDGFLQARESGLIPQTLPLNWTAENYTQILLAGKTYEDLDDAGKAFVDGLTINTPYYFATGPSLSTPAVVDKGADVFDKINVVRDKYVTGAYTKEQYDAEYAKIKAAGLDEINKEVGAAYANLLK